MFSLLDGFSSYNQVLVVEPDHLKATFRTKWGTFSFKRMTFEIINVGATFQRVIDIAFHGLIGQSIVVYLDDVIVFSKRRSDNVHHLKQIFEQCLKYEIYLNPLKIIFDVSEGTLLGNIIAKSGIKVDPKRVKAITQIPLLVNKKAMQSFFGKINFLQKFIFDYAQIVKPLQGMINYKWENWEKHAFAQIKQVIVDAPTLFSPNYGKYFLLYTFVADSSITAVLTQKNVEGNECPIYFTSAGLQGPEINYPAFEKQAYVVYKLVKHFRPYLLKSHTIIFVPQLAVRKLFVQHELGEKRENYMNCLQ